MSIYSNVTEQDLINLRKLAEQQREQRALKVKNKILKQTHDIKSAESLSPITERLDEVEKTTQKVKDIIKESQPERPQLTTENTSTHQPIENNEGVLYDVELENTLKNMTINTGFSKTYYDRERDWKWNSYPVEMLRGSEVKIHDKKLNITPNLQKTFTQRSDIPLKNLNHQEWEIYKNILETLDFENYKPKSGENKSGRYKYSKTNL